MFDSEGEVFSPGATVVGWWIEVMHWTDSLEHELLGLMGTIAPHDEDSKVWNLGPERSRRLKEWFSKGDSLIEEGERLAAVFREKESEGELIGGKPEFTFSFILDCGNRSLGRNLRALMGIISNRNTIFEVDLLFTHGHTYMTLARLYWLQRLDR